MQARVRKDRDEDASNWLLKGVDGNWICDGKREYDFGMLGKRADMRSRKVGFGAAARNAIEKSVSPIGDDGVTMIAGSSAFSSTRGSERS